MKSLEEHGQVRRIQYEAILKKPCIEGDYEGIANLILGYAARPSGNAEPRKADYVYRV